MKIALRIIVIIGLFLITLEVSTYFYRRVYSKSIASEMVQKFCRDKGYDLAKLTGPTDENAGIGPPCYSWSYNDATHHLELVVALDNFYDGEVAIWDNNRKD